MKYDIQQDLLAPHSKFNDSDQWSLTEKGIKVGSGDAERTPGEPSTVTRIWNDYHEAINEYAGAYNVPVELIVATIATETGGDESAVREEPGYTSDEETPHKVSPGVMQTLISTARATLAKRGVAESEIDRQWLLTAANAIKAGTSFIADQKSKTKYDPVLVAAAYNAGGIYEQTGAENRFKLRQYPIGSSEHCDRFIKWFNDFWSILPDTEHRPAVSFWEYFQGFSLPLDIGTELKPTHEAFETYFKHTEQEFFGGYFPVGGNTTWHGGVHLFGKDGDTIHAVADGMVVCARMPAQDPKSDDLKYGSRNFVLIRHGGNGQPLWYSLYYHLKSVEKDSDEAKQIGWISREEVKVKMPVGMMNPDNTRIIHTFQKNDYAAIVREEDNRRFIRLPDPDRIEYQGYIPTNDQIFETVTRGTGVFDTDEVVELNATVTAGEVIGFLGEGLTKNDEGDVEQQPILHWAIFSPERRSGFLDWVDDENEDFLCDNQEIVQLIDTSLEEEDGAFLADGVLTSDEIAEFFKDEAQAKKLRPLACKFKSEWAVDWAEQETALNKTGLSCVPNYMHLYTMWGDTAKIEKKLPTNGHVWHYNPITFLYRLLAWSARATFTSEMFEADKSFLLPRETISLLSNIGKFQNSNDIKAITLVGHKGVAGDKRDAAELSLKRADAIAAVLKLDTDAFDKAIQAGDWGDRERRIMLAWLRNSESAPYYSADIEQDNPDALDAAVRAFQRDNGLTEDGDAGKLTFTKMYELILQANDITKVEDIEIETRGAGDSHTDAKGRPDACIVEAHFWKTDIDPSVERYDTDPKPVYKAWANSVRQELGPAAPWNSSARKSLLLRRYATPERKLEHGDELDPGSFVYVFRDGYLWRELAVVKDGKLQEVDLARGYGKNRRAAWGDAETQLEVPADGTVEIAVAPVQWSWARVLAFGGLHPSDPRKGADTIQVDPIDEAKRTARLTTLDLGQLEEENWPEPWCKPDDFADREDLKPYQGKELPVFHADDPVGWVRGLAGQYQDAWFEHEDYISALSDPKRVDEHPFAPWFDSAVLANQYFFVEQPDIEAPGVKKDPGPDETRALKKAKEQREEWRKNLNLGDIQAALGIERRRQLREKIRESKLPLVDYLNEQRNEDSPFIVAIDDIATLPGWDRESGDSAAQSTGYEMLFKLADEILAKLGVHEFTLDRELETEPPSQQEIYQLAKNDPGAKLLCEIGDPESGHALHVRLFPPEESAQGTPTASETAEEHNPLFSKDKLLTVGRRAMQAINAWVDHFASAAAENKQVQKSVANFVSETRLGFKLSKIEIPLEEYLKGNLAELGSEYEILRVQVRELDQNIRNSAAKGFKGGQVEVEPGKSIPLDLETPEGRIFAASSVEALEKGSALSPDKFNRKANTSGLWEQTIEVWVGKKATGAEGIAEWAFDKGVWSGAILPIVGMLELWNLQSYTTAWLEAEKAGKDTSRALVDLGGAIADIVAIGTSINEARHSVAHHAAEKRDGKRLPKSEKYVKATRFAKGFGAAAGAYSAGLSFYDMVRNAQEGDDAAIAHSIMGAGFVLTMASDIAGLAVISYGATNGVLMFLSGPVGWIGLAVVLAGAALLTWVFTEDPPMEEWLKNGPFSQREQPTLLRRPGAAAPGPEEEHERYVDPEDGSQLLLKADRRILRIGSKNESFREGANGTIYKRQENGKETIVGRIGEPLDLSRVADRSNRFGGRFERWQNHPKSAYEALLEAIYGPTVRLSLYQDTIASPWEAVLTVELPSFIENKSLVSIQLWQSEHGRGWKKDYQNTRLVTADAGSGPRTVQVIQPLRNQYRGKVRAVVRLDLYGDGKVVLPVNQSVERVAGPPPERMQAL